MKYDNKILEKIYILDLALKELNREPLLNNGDFNIDELTSGLYLKLNLKRGVHVPRLSIMISPFEFLIDLDRIGEAYAYSHEQFLVHTENVKSQFKTLLTSTIKIVYCGSHYTKAYFFDSAGNCVGKIREITGLYLKIGCTSKEYPPIYPNY